MSIFELLREQVRIEDVVQYQCGSSGRKVRCVAPNHEDANPSMHLYDDYAHCFSCGFHGDVVNVWAAIKGFERPIEAAIGLAGEYGVELPEMKPGTQEKMRARRAREERNCAQAQACHNALDQHPGVVEWWEGRGFCTELRGRFLLGTDKSGTAAVIPFWNCGRVQGLIRRNRKGEPKYIYPKADEFAAGYRPLFVPGSLRADVFLVEGIIDALALAALGESVAAVGGTSISKPQMRELQRLRGMIYILPDRDEECEAAAREWVHKLYPKALLCPAEYGEEVGHA